MNQAPQDSKETPAHRDSQGHKDRLELQERRVPLESLDYLECQELMALQVTLEKRVQLARKDTWALLDLKAQLVILDPEV